MRILAGSLFFLLSLFFAVQGRAQSGNSPYSRFGLGELAPSGTIYNRSMGGIGVSTSSQAYINTINPALLGRNKIAGFEAAVSGEVKTLDNGQITRQHVTGNLGYLAFAFPIAKRWTTGFGMSPYSTANYTLVSEQKLPQTPTFVENSLKGSGSITKVYWANGFDIGKGLYLGVQLNYHFGLTRSESISRLIDSQGGYSINLYDQLNYSAFSYMAGLAYRAKVGKETTLNFGVTYDPSANWNATKFKSIQRLTQNDLVVSGDTLVRNEAASFSLPQKLSYGISIEKPFHYTFGIDFSQQNWSEFQGAESIQVGTLNNTYRIAAGGEWIPNLASLDSYFSRVAYRAGAYYAQLPVTLSGMQIDEFGINFGLSLPVNRNFSGLNLGFTYGQRGTTQSGLIKESFFRINVGISVNDPLWFQKRRIN